MKDAVKYMREYLNPQSAGGQPSQALKIVRGKCPALIGNEESALKFAIHIISNAYDTKIKKTKKTELPLTYVLFRLGQGLELCYPPSQGYTKVEQAHLGGMIVETLLQTDYIDLIRGKAKTAPYNVVFKPKWWPLWERVSVVREAPNSLQGTLLECPQDISGPRQGSRILGRNLERIPKDSWVNNKFVKGLDVIQQTSWRINEEVLAVANREYGNMEKPKPVFRGGKKPYDTAARLYENNPTKATKRSLDKARDAWLEERQSQQALSKFQRITSILTKANGLVNEPEFYQLVNLDTRGRVYSMETFLEFPGHELSRSLYKFTEGTVLDADALKELKIHTANVYNSSYDIDNIPEWCTKDYKAHLESQGLRSISLDKMAYVDRIAWVDNHWGYIMEVAEMGSVEESADKPWLFLAACLELRGYSENPEGFISTLPCSLDGMVSVLQHISAITRDEDAGAQVALVDSEIPKDLYLEVVRDMVLRNPEYFAESSIPLQALRKSVGKVALMRRAYSAGIETIAMDIQEELEDSGIALEHGLIPSDYRFLAEQAFQSIQEVCPKANVLLDFLKEVVELEVGTYEPYLNGQKITAYKISKLRQERDNIHALVKREKRSRTDLEDVRLAEISTLLNSIEYQLVSGNGSTSLTWITPSGHPVIEEHFHETSVRVAVHIKGANKSNRVNLRYNEVSDKVDKKKFISSIAANMIHSMDSAHLQLVAAAFNKPLGCIHDSISASAGHIQELRRIIAEEFVSMYQDTNHLEQIKDTLVTVGGDSLVVPELGSLDLEEVKQSRYFFS